MGMIDRYLKKGGFLQLLALIETTGGEKREKFLKIIAEENPAWEHEIKKKMLTLEKIFAWNPSYLMEVFPRIPTATAAALFNAVPADKRDIVINGIPFAERKKLEAMREEKEFSTGEVTSAVMRLMAEIRSMAQLGLLKFEKFDQDMVIPDNIEDLLSSGRIPVSEKELAAAYPTPAPTAGSTGSNEELTQLRRNLVQANQENHRLKSELQTLKDRLEQIRKIA